jgi:hypothetical protein
MPTSVHQSRRSRKPTKLEATELKHRGDRPKKVIRAPDPQSLLYTRQQTARLLNVSVATLIRMENSGRLTALKLDPDCDNALVYHRAAEVRALARSE